MNYKTDHFTVKYRDIFAVKLQKVAIYFFGLYHSISYLTLPQ